MSWVFYHNKKTGLKKNVYTDQDHNYVKVNMDQGFPGGAVVENLPANARDTGSSPGLGRSHMPRSSWAREPQLLSLRIWSLSVLCNRRGRDSERPVHRDEEWPPLATTRESPRTETKTPHSHKYIYIHTYIHKVNMDQKGTLTSPNIC